MKFKRRFTEEGKSPYEMFEYEKRSSTLRNPDGSEVFSMESVEVPKGWSQMASDILAQKYFRKTGVPLTDESGRIVVDQFGNVKTGSENSAKQVVNRLAQCWREWGEKYGYFTSEADAQVFYDETVYMLLNQMCAPNSPQWFNTGLKSVYGIAGKKQGHFYVDPDSKELKESEDAYSRPQPHACFIQSVKDDLVNDGGIFDLSTREARIFKFGSGTGTNFSALRGEKESLSGGGISSGLMSFLKIFDRAAGAIKSGGTTRRAAKMVIVDIDHPDVESFITWKANEEAKVAALVAGSKINSRFLQAIIDEAVAHGSDHKKNASLNNLIQKALHRGVPLNYIERVIHLISQGYTQLNLEVYDTHYEGEAYNTVSGQNSNNSIRVTNEYMQAVIEDKQWHLKWRTDSSKTTTVSARALWEKILMSAWACADPGLQFDTTINEWHTCPNSGRINASNPCSEYMFLDDTACNLASFNLRKFFDDDRQVFLVDDFKHAVRIWTTILEISVLMAQFPSREVAQKSYDFRTLGLGYANLGSLLMVSGIPYDSPKAFAMTGAISSLLTSESYKTSAEMASEIGTFPEFEINRNEMLRVIRNHRRAAYNTAPEDYEGLSIIPRGIKPELCPEELLMAVRKSWDEALDFGEKFGFRNAQVSVIAPTGTIGLLMDCDTTGIEPDFAIVKFKKLAGGGYFKIVNQSVSKALKNLGYSEKQIDEISKYCIGHASFANCPHINKESLLKKEFSTNTITQIEKSLDRAFDVKFVFNKWTVGEETCKKLGFTQEQLDDSNFNMLAALGFSKEEIEEANDYICGTMMIEGAPHIQNAHLPIFDTANKCGKKGKRFIPYMGHVRMMAAAQPFITGAISKTVNMPSEVSVTEIGEVYMQSWQMMLKAIAIYRDNSKLSQPLNSANFDDLDEAVLLGDENNADEGIGPREIHETIVERIYGSKPQRYRLPKKRTGHVREAYVGGHKVYLRTGEYEDGSLGEIFIDMYKEGASFKGLLNCFAVLTSKALQYGIPLEELVDTFTFTRFEPAGPVQGHEAIKTSTSILDYVFRSLGYDYLKRDDFIHVKAVDELSENEKKSEKKKKKTAENKKEQIQEPSREEDETNLSAVEVNSEPATIPAKTEDGFNGNGNGKNGKHSFTKEAATSDYAKAVATPAGIIQYSSSDAKQVGYTGETCINCGSSRVIRNGSCTLCLECGATTGCS